MVGKIVNMLHANRTLYQKIFQASASSTATAASNSEIDVPQLIKNLKPKIESAKDGAELLGIFNRASGGDKGLTQVNEIFYTLGDFSLLTVSHELAQDLEKNLKIANSLVLQSAPIFIDKIDTKDPTKKVLVILTPGMSGDLNQFDSYATASVKGKLDSKAKSIFLEELMQLFDKGYVNTMVIDDTRSLRVNPKSGLIHASDWSILELSKGLSRQEYENQVKEVLQLS